MYYEAFMYAISFNCDVGMGEALFCSPPLFLSLDRACFTYNIKFIGLFQCLPISVQP